MANPTIKFTDTMSDEGRECPYCGWEYQPEAETYSEDNRIEECESCGKNYHAYESFTVTHHAKPDCEINNLAHNYQPIKLMDGRSHEFCVICDKCRPGQPSSHAFMVKGR